jgi:putative colanic acid biosynthesis UDP-glucose lipid carrier transferase
MKNINFKFIFSITDLFLLNISISLAAFLKFNNGIEYHSVQYPTLFVVFNIIWLFLLVSAKPHQQHRISRIFSRLQKIISLIIIHGLLVSGFWVITKAYYYSREFLVMFYAFWIISSTLVHIILSQIERRYRLSRFFKKRKVVILGYGELSIELETFFRAYPEFGYKFEGYFDDKERNNKIIGSSSELFSYVKSHDIEDIYCCIPYLESNVVKETIAFGDENFLKVKLIADYRGFSYKALELQRYDHIPILNIAPVPLDSWRNRFVKRIFDIFFSFIVIITIFPWLYPIVAIAIKLSSRGPVLFRQGRTGKGNDDFLCYKFRTMRINDDADSLQAKKNDPRITKVGEFLRKTSIDELPQFFNVFFGSMSLIGPRPHPMNLNKQFDTQIEKFMARHFVKPGISGLAQAKGYRGPTLNLHQMKSRIKLDLFYIENWSLWLDIKIVVMTILAILKGDENAF